MKSSHLRRALLLGMVLSAWPAPSGAPIKATLSPETAAAYERILQALRPRIEKEVPRSGFLGVDRKPGSLRNLRNGDILVRPGKLPGISVRGGIAHYWAGAMFDAGTDVQAYARVLLAFDQHHEYYPDVVRSRLESQDGGTYRSRLRIVKTKVLTATLDVDFETGVLTESSGLVFLYSRATRIQEVENPGSAEEKILPVGQDSGFLWRQDTYWRLSQGPDGAYVELITLSLSRDIPTGLGWMIRPFLTSVPKETIEQTLQATRLAVHR